MEINYLREFVVLAQVCRFQEAADMLYISQSSLSKHIKSLEEELGSSLFRRTTRKVELSDFGKEFLPYAARIAEIQLEYTNILLPKLHNKSTIISMGISPIVTLYNLLSFIPAFSKKFPDCQLDIFENEKDILLDMLRKNQCTMIIIDAPDPALREEFEVLPYTEDTLVALLPANHPLAERDAVSVEELSAEPYIQLGKNGAWNISTSKPSVVVSRASMLMDLVQKGVGVSIMTRYAAANYLISGVSVVPIAPTHTAEMSILFSKSNRSSPAIKAVLEYINFRKS